MREFRIKHFESSNKLTQIGKEKKYPRAGGSALGHFRGGKQA
jgi:hypothetical protein